MCPRQLVHGRLVEGGSHDLVLRRHRAHASHDGGQPRRALGMAGPAVVLGQPARSGDDERRHVGSSRGRRRTVASPAACRYGVDPSCGEVGAPIDLAGMGLSSSIAMLRVHRFTARARSSYAARDGGRHAGMGGRPRPVRSTATRWCGSTRTVPDAGPGEVRLHVRVCGVCRTDLHLTEGDLLPRRPRVTPGHEVVGIVDQLGPGSNRWRVGDRLGVPWLAHTCGTCAFCVSRPREPLPDAALHRLGRGRWVRAVRRGGRGLRLRAPGRIRRYGGCAAALCRDHRLPGPAALQSPRGRPARPLRLRRLRPSHGPGRAGPRRPRPRHDPLPGGAKPGARAGRRQRGGRRRPTTGASRLGHPLRTGRIPRAARAGRPGPGRDSGRRRHLPERRARPRLPEAPLRGAERSGA